MGRMSETLSIPNLEQRPECVVLEASDVEWLARFDPGAASSLPFLMAGLNDLVEAGSRHADNVSPEDKAVIRGAREQFYRTIGFDDDQLSKIREIYPSLTPVDTFISAQRVYSMHGVPGARVINTMPQLLYYDGAAVEERMDVLASEGIDVRHAVSKYPNILTLAPESLRHKLQAMVLLGLDVGKMGRVWPSGLGHSLDRILLRLDAFEQAGIDGVKAINTAPNIMSISIDAIAQKIEDLGRMGLDAEQVVRTHPNLLALPSEKLFSRMRELEGIGVGPGHLSKQPSLLGYGPEKIAQKIDYLRRLAGIFEWRYDVSDLIDAYPAVLAFDRKKLGVLARIAAEKGAQEDGQLEPTELAAFLRTPVESYLVTIADKPDMRGLLNLYRETRKTKDFQAERRDKATRLSLANKLGRLGTSYLAYRP